MEVQKNSTDTDTLTTTFKQQTTGNAICIKNIGLFAVYNEKENYWNSINNCQKMGADLADISSEIRTRHLSKVLNSSLQGWYKVAYVGMDDIKQEGNFVTVSGSPLTCSAFRAWAPGHPRSLKEHEDCVVLDSERLWRVVDCETKLPFLCEFYPDKPKALNDLVNVSCGKIRNKLRKKKCEEQWSLYELFENLTRRERCAIINYEDNSPLMLP